MGDWQDGCYTCNSSTSHSNTVLANFMVMLMLCLEYPNQFHQLATNLDAIKTAQVADTTLSNVMKALTSGCPIPTNVAPGIRCVFLQDGVLCRPFQSSSSTTCHTQIVIPASLKTTVLQQLHKHSGHLGEQKTAAKVKERYYWPGYEADIAKWIQECRECQRRKPPQQA